MIRIYILSFILVMAFPWPGQTQTTELAEAPTAVESGLSLEGCIEADLAAAGFRIIPNREWREAILYETTDPRIVILDAPYRSIYGHKAKIEFLILLGTRQILVEAKRQRVPGSVDEKLAYVYLNALNAIPEREFVLVVEGEGFKPEALAWIRAKARETLGFTVLGPDELIDWLLP